MRRITIITIACISLMLLFSRCELMYALLVESGDNCERYSIYRSTIFGNDDLLWEETACDYERDGIEDRFNEKFAYYKEVWSSSYVYEEHVTYSQY